MADKEKMYNFEIDPKKVKNVSMSRYSDGYSYASMSLKVDESSYMNISYEWKGDTIPSFAMDMMDILKNSGMETSSSDSEVLARAGKVFTDIAAKMKKKDDKKSMPFNKEDMPMDEDEEEEDKEGKKKAKKKKGC